nr:transposase domain-containing protein [Sphingomonas sp. CFBP 8760]
MQAHWHGCCRYCGEPGAIADPQAYITDVIGKIAGDWPASEWDQLMPWYWMSPADHPIVQAA